MVKTVQNVSLLIQKCLGFLFKCSDYNYIEQISVMIAAMILSLCLFVLLLYVPSQQLWSLRVGQFT